MSDSTLSNLVPDTIWRCEHPVKFSGVWLKCNTTVVRLNDGGVWVHSPAEPTDAMRKSLKEIGPVRWLVMPNRFHYLHAAANVTAFPEAKLVGPQSVLEKMPGATTLDTEIASEELRQAIPQLVPFHIDGLPFLDETVFFHPETGTLIGADFVMRASERDHWTWRFASRLLGCFQKVSIPPDVRKKARRQESTAISMRAILALPIERVLVCHADPIDTDPVEQLTAAWRACLAKFPEAT